MPHYRVASGDSCEIAKTSRSVTKDIQILIALGKRVHQPERQQMRQMTGCSQHLIMTLDLHMLDVCPESTPHGIYQSQSCRICLGHRRQNNLVPLEQTRIRGFDTTLLRPGNRMPGDKACRHRTKSLSRCTHDITFGAAHIGQYCMPQIHTRQQAKHFLHGQNRHRQLNDIGTTAGGCKISFAAIHHTQLYSQHTRCRVQIDPDHLGAQSAFAHAFGEGAANQAQPDHNQTPHYRLYRFQRHYINHEQEPWPAPQAGGCFPTAGQ